MDVAPLDKRVAAEPVDVAPLDKRVAAGGAVATQQRAHKQAYLLRPRRHRAHKERLHPRRA